MHACHACDCCTITAAGVGRSPARHARGLPPPLNTASPLLCLLCLPCLLCSVTTFPLEEWEEAMKQS